MVSDLHIINNWFERRDIRSVRELSGLVFANNVVYSGTMLLLGAGHGVFFNNNFLQIDKEGTYSYQQTGLRIPFSGRFFNNIMWTGRGGTSIQTQLNSNNLVADTYSEVFTDEGDWAKNYFLKEDSSARGAGLNGEDLGIFGGIHTWNLTQQPPLPIISRIEAPRVVGAGEGLKVTVEVQSNN